MDLLLQLFAGIQQSQIGKKRMGLTIAALLTFVVGCGGSATTSPDPAGTSNTAAMGSASDSTDGTSSSNAAGADGTSGNLATAKVKHGRGEVWVDDKGQKWFGDVPMDAFFDQPYTVASNTTPIGDGAATNAVVSNTDSRNVPGPAMTETTTPPVATVATPPQASGDSWGDLISETVLDDEVKTIRNFLNENLQSVSNYNASMLMIPPKAATLAALAGVAMEHPNAVSWKEDAKYVRNLAKKMNSDTLRSGPKDQKRLLEMYEGMSDTLNRSRPAGLEEPPESDGFAEVAEMRLLMHRMAEAEKRMKTEAGTDSSMTSRKDMVVHEASVMATLAKIITLQGYGYEDDPAFKGYANEVIKSALAIKEAADSNDFATYELSLTKVSTTCSSCHSEYKNN